jgi:serine/threonine protein kinase
VAALSPSNILALFDVGSDGGVTYAVMEFLDGETLRGAAPVLVAFRTLGVLWVVLYYLYRNRRFVRI